METAARDGVIAGMVLQLRGDRSNPHTMENSMRKAYTARTTRAPSGNLVKRLKDDPSLSFIHLQHVIAAQGALPIKVGDEVIGAAVRRRAGRREGRIVHSGRTRQGRRATEIAIPVAPIGQAGAAGLSSRGG